MKIHFGSLASTVVVAFLLCPNVPLSAQIVDPAFSSPAIFRPGTVSILRQAAKGKLYVAGSFTHSGEREIGNLVRLTPGGFLDTSFNPELPKGERITAFDVLPNGNVVVGTSSGDFNRNCQVHVLAVDGRKLKVLESDKWHYGIPYIKALPDNRFLVSGDASLTLFTRQFNVDNTFAPDFYSDAPLGDIELQGSKIIVAGDFGEIGPDRDHLIRRTQLARINLDGTIDPTFDFNLELYLVSGTSVQPDGKIILDYTADVNQVIRLHPDGSRDESFHYNVSGGAITSFYNNGKITLQTRDRILRLTEDGSEDPSFHPISISADTRMTVLPDQSIITGNDGNARFGMAKYDPAGNPTNAYKAQLLQPGQVYSMIMDGNSHVIAGDFVKVNETVIYNVAKLHSTGKVDKSFVENENHGVVKQVGNYRGNILLATGSDLIRLDRYGKVDPAFNFQPFLDLNSVRKFIIQKDGKILVGGTATGNIYRLNQNGSYDASFNTGTGFRYSVYNASVPEYDFDLDWNSGKIIYYGLFDSFDGAARKLLVRLNADGSLDTSFNQASQGSGGSPSKVKILPNGEVLAAGRTYVYNGYEIPYAVFKVNSQGILDETFLSNYYGQIEYNINFVQAFRGRILLAENQFYSGFTSYVVDSSGKRDDTFSFPANITIDYLNNYFSPDDTRLFVLGNVFVNGKLQSITKLIFNDQTLLAATQATAFSDGISPEPGKTSFYPNPATHMLNISTSQRSEVMIYSLLGEMKLSTSVNGQDEQIDVKALPPGRYVIQIKSGGRTTREHLLKE
jgi:uncharacterized delta-60 repeat protein